jgi:hypothetical protein
MAMLPLAESVGAATASRVVSAQIAAAHATAAAQHVATMRLAIVCSFIASPSSVVLSMKTRNIKSPPTCDLEKLGSQAEFSLV